jgi:plastocyanin
VAAETEAVHNEIARIITLSVDLLGARDVDEADEPVAEILELAQRANGEGVFAIDRAARAAGVVAAPRAEVAATLGEPGEVTVREDAFLFLPSALTIPSGTTVTWINDERAKHTATADDGAFDSGNQDLGQSYSVTFNESGVFPYYCRYHGDSGGVGMAGTIVVE